MSKSKKTQNQRRTAEEWAELVEAWRRSGQTARDFGAERGVPPGRLPWWRWRLARIKAGKSTPEAVGVGLVRVEVEPAIAGTPRWELRSAAGDVLVGHEPLSAEMLGQVLGALGIGRSR